MSKNIITQEVTLSFPNLLEPVADQKGNLKYAAQLIFDPTRPVTAPGSDIQAVKAAILEVAKEVYNDKAAQLLKSGALKTSIRTDWETKNYPEGSVFFSARSKYRPGLVGRDLKTVSPDRIEEMFYPGARVRASVNIFYSEYQEGGKVLNKGIWFGLNHLQWIGDGPRLDNRKGASETFDELPELAPADLSDLESATA